MYTFGIYSDSRLMIYLDFVPSAKSTVSFRPLGIISCLRSHPASLHSSTTTSSQEPRSSTSKSTWVTGLRKAEKLACDLVGYSRERGQYCFGYINLRSLRWEEANDLGDGGDFETGSDADQEVAFVSVVVDEAVVESGRELFAEERDVRLRGKAVTS